MSLRLQRDGQVRPGQRRAASMDLSASGLPGLGGLGLSTIVTGGTAYEGGAAFAGRLADGKSWIGLPYSQFVSSSSAGAQSDGQLAQLAWWRARHLEPAGQHGHRPRGRLHRRGQRGALQGGRHRSATCASASSRAPCRPAAKSQAEAMFSQGDLAFVVSIDGSQRLKQDLLGPVDLRSSAPAS